MTISSIISRKLRPTWLLAILLTAPIVTISASQTTPRLGIRENNPDAHAFVNARIVVSPERTIEHGTLLIEQGRIVEVGPDVKLPEGIIIIDLGGYTIYPGFIDPYTDYGLPNVEPTLRSRNDPPDYYGERVGGDAWNDAIHAEQKSVDRFSPNQADALELKKLGFTTVQSVQKDGVFRGRAFVTQLSDGLPNDLIINPIGSHALSFSKGSSTQEYPSSIMGSIAIIRQMFYDADWYFKAQSAFAADPSTERVEYNAALQALAGFRSDAIIIDPGESRLGPFRIEQLKQEFGINPIAVAGGYEYEWLDDLKQPKLPFILPVDFPENPKVGTFEDDLDLTLPQLRHWEQAPSNAARLAESGLKFGFTTHRLKQAKQFRENVRTAIKRGLTTKQALAALTTIPAEMCGIGNQAGTLEPGKLADFFITDGDYFDKQTDLYEIWIGGEKTHLKDRPVADYRGDYSLSVNDQTYQLSIKGKPSKLEGTIKKDKLSAKLTRIETDRLQLSFAAELDSSGLARFTGQLKQNRLTGECELGSGKMVAWSAEPAEPTPDSSETIEQPESEEPFLPVARLTHPNMPYGYEQLPARQNVLVKNATIWTSDEAGILEETDLLIKDGKFQEIGQDLSAPEGYEIIDATGKHLTPGIIDAHSHIAGEGDINEGTHAITPEVRLSDIVDPNSIHIYRQLAGGVTTSMLLHGSANPIGGQCQVLKLKWGSNPEEMKFNAGPDIIKFALGENVKQSNWGENMTTRYPQSRMGVEAIIADAFRAAVDYEAAWARYNALSKKAQARTVPPRRDLQLDALVEVLHDRMMVHCHSYMASETVMLIRLAEQFGFTLDVFVHMLEGYKVADELAAHGAGATAFSDWWAYKFEVYDAIPYNAGLMHDRGVLTTLNSDNVDLARRLNQEAGKIVMYNDLDQEEALKMVTISSARQFGRADRIGSVTVGKDADFVIWSDNPLSMYARAEQTWIEGARYYDIDTNEKMIAEVAAEKDRLIQKVLESGQNGKSHRGGDAPKGSTPPDNERSER